ncbi:hypothetical protein RhiirA4_467723 [Rhizophagus irregularis]|uniref:Uncharacterized protein n=1 Tax=Rhizophagus irregularis TaxID=588596 RepID=A0A2I1GWE7_9GLOM|nr:hypothetical protein RhiirA4_467723 [Rhizophagus irregularis]
MINPNVNRYTAQILKTRMVAITKLEEFLNLLILMQQIVKLQRWNFRKNYQFLDPQQDLKE